MTSGASRLRTLRRIIAGLPDAVSSMRPAIWPAEYGDEHRGIRRPEFRWAAAWDHRLQLQPQLDAPGPASEEHQTHTHGCILLSLVQLQSETDARRSHSLACRLPAADLRAMEASIWLQTTAKLPFFFFGEEEVLHVHQSCQSQQYHWIHSSRDPLRGKLLLHHK